MVARVDEYVLSALAGTMRDGDKADMAGARGGIDTDEKGATGWQARAL